MCLLVLWLVEHVHLDGCTLMDPPEIIDSVKVVDCAVYMSGVAVCRV